MVHGFFSYRGVFRAGQPCICPVVYWFFTSQFISQGVFESLLFKHFLFDFFFYDEEVSHIVVGVRVNKLEILSLILRQPLTILAKTTIY